MSDEIQSSGPTFDTVSRIIELLDPLSAEDREHVFRTVGTWFRLSTGSSLRGNTPSPSPASSSAAQRRSTEDDKFSDRPLLSVKDFILEKEPSTEVERLACLAYYLTHYQETPHFKTVDLSRLNTEAAQRKLSNPAVAAGNAMRDGFFVQAPRGGYRQLSAMGERFVQVLPNREAAQQVRQKMTSRRGKRGGGSRSESKDGESQRHGEQDLE
jgi:hypothetical protein